MTAEARHCVVGKNGEMLKPVQVELFRKNEGSLAPTEEYVEITTFTNGQQYMRTGGGELRVLFEYERSKMILTK